MRPIGSFYFRKKNTLLYERTTIERRMFMESSLNHLRTVIRRTEDSLLVSKDPYEIERIRTALRKLRVEEQKKRMALEQKRVW